jgi:hypothetical protein
MAQPPIEPIRGVNFSIPVARATGDVWHAGRLAGALVLPDGIAEISDEELSSGVLPERLEEHLGAVGPDVTIDAVTCWFTVCGSAVIISDLSEMGVIAPASWPATADGDDLVSLVAQDVRAAGLVCVSCFGEPPFPDVVDDLDELPDPRLLQARVSGQGFSVDQSPSGTARLIRGHRAGGRQRTWVEVRGVVTASFREDAGAGAIADDGNHVVVFGNLDASRLILRGPNGAVRWETALSSWPLTVAIDSSGAYVVASFRPVERAPIFVTLWSAGLEPDWSVQFPFVPEETLIDSAAGIVALSSSRDGTLRLRLEGGDAVSEGEAMAVAAGDPFALLEGIERAIKAGDSLDRADTEAALRLAIDNRLNRYPRFEARAWRAIGELADAAGDLDAAYAAYSTALSLDPKVGVSRRFKELPG